MGVFFMQELNPSLFVYAQDREIKSNEYLIVSNKDNINSDILTQYPFKCENLIKADEHIRENAFKDTYTTIATFLAPSRKEIFINKVYEHYIDIDQHDSLLVFNIDQARQFIEDLKPYFNKEIPQPSYIVHSGRGIQIHIKLLCANDLNKWKETQKGLIERFNKVLNDLSKLNAEYSLLNIDKKCKDPNRLLRTPGTINTKSNTYASVIYTSNKNYTQDEILEEFNLTIQKGNKSHNIEHLNELKDLNQDKALKLYEYRNDFKTLTQAQKRYTLNTLYTYRAQDLFKLIDLRNHKGILEGYRNNLIAIATPIFYEKNKRDSIKALDDLLELNDYFEKPLKDNEVKAWLNSWERTKYKLNFKTETIVNALEITLEEQKHLKALISNSFKCDKYRNANREVLNAKKRIAYRIDPKKKIESVKTYNKEHQEQKKTYYKDYYKQNKAIKLDNANSRYAPKKAINKMNKAILRARVHEMREQGIKYNEIAKALNISKRTALRYIEKKEE